ncbi:hypothetical protein U0E23_34315, partial [Burkholderia stagnalis]
MTERAMGVTRACGLVGISRSLFHYESRRRVDDVGRKVIMSHFARSKSEPPFSTVSLLRAKAGDAPEGTVDANP